MQTERQQYSLIINYSGTRFLSTENQKYSISWWIPSLIPSIKITSLTCLEEKSAMKFSGVPIF